MNDIEKPFSELPLDADLTNGSWCWGFSKGNGFIEYVAEDLSSTRYNMPKAVIQAIEFYAEHRVKENQNIMRQAIGLPNI
jgi:hypothetical protein